MMKQTIITYPSSIKDWHLHMPSPNHSHGGQQSFFGISTLEAVRIQNRLYGMLESWRVLLEQHFGLSCRWNKLRIDQGPFSLASADETQLIFLIKDEQISFSWSFDDHFVRHLLGFSFGLSAEESGQLVYSDMEQLFFKQVYADTMSPVLDEMSIFCLDPQTQNGRREANTLIADQDAYYQFHFEMKVPSLNDTVCLTLSFTEKMLNQFMTCPVSSTAYASRVVLNPMALGQIQTKVESWLGHVDLSFGELKDLQPGDVLVVNRGLREPVELKIAGELSFNGTLGLSNQRLSVQLLDHVKINIQKTGDDSPDIPDNADSWFAQAQSEQSESDFVSILENPEDQSELEFDWEKL